MHCCANEGIGKQFLLNQNSVPGLKNSTGLVVVTPDSDVKGALAAAMSTWNSVPTTAARFAPFQTTTLVNNPNDGNNVIVFIDTPAIRGMLDPDLTALVVMALIRAKVYWRSYEGGAHADCSHSAAPEGAESR